MATHGPGLKPHHHLQLFTTQKRLRHLHSVGVRNLIKSHFVEEMFFTLHTIGAEEAFYQSERLQDSSNLTWNTFDSSSFAANPANPATAASVVVKIWGTQARSDALDIQLMGWTIHFSGLNYLGKQLHKDGVRYEKNCIVLGLCGGYFTAPEHSENAPTPLLSIPVNATSLRRGYNVNTLIRIRTIERAVEQTGVSGQKLKLSIEESLAKAKAAKDKNREMEMLRANVRLLREERKIQNEMLQREQEKLTQQNKLKQEQNQRLQEDLRKLSEDIENLKELKNVYIHQRETCLKESAQLMMRRRQLMSDLAFIFPLHISKNENISICGAFLPNSEEFSGHDELRIAVALGYVAHLLKMVGLFLNIPLRYTITFSGSRSTIRDHVTSKLSDKDWDFPLFSKGQEKFQFNYGVYLVNKNIAQLRFYCGLGTTDLRLTLLNLKMLLELKLGVKFHEVLPQPMPSLPSSSLSTASSAHSSNTSKHFPDQQKLYRQQLSLNNSFPKPATTSVPTNIPITSGNNVSSADVGSEQHQNHAEVAKQEVMS